MLASKLKKERTIELLKDKDNMKTLMDAEDYIYRIVALVRT